MRNFESLDLNLLLTLDALLDERHVTRAAARLNLSQPSVSVQLAKLREAFEDPLLLAGPRGMLPTARAEELRRPLKAALEGLRAAVAPTEPFDPGHARQTWRVAATDYSEMAVLLPAVDRMRQNAPGTRLAAVETPPLGMAKQLEIGDIDLGFQTVDRVAPHLRSSKLFDEQYVLVGREGHPRLGKRPTLNQFCALEHAIVSPDGGGFLGATDTALEELGIQRRVVISLPHFLVVMAVVRQTDVVAMLPSRLVQESQGLRVHRAPVEIPGFQMAMVWHERLHRDPAHRWLRTLIEEAVA